MYHNIEFVICAAGECTRNQPHSKAIAHKALLPMGDKRIIDYTLKDITRMGGRHITIVCSNRRAINAFKRALATDLKTEQKLRQKGRGEIADIMHDTFLPKDIDLKFAIQKKPWGTGHVLYVARKAIHNRHVVLLFPDDLFISKNAKKTHMKKLVDTFLKHPTTILLTGVEKEDVRDNGILVNNRLVEKSPHPVNNIAAYSPIAIPNQVIKFLIHQSTKKIKAAKTKNQDWLYVDSINDFLDQGGEATGFSIKMLLKNPQDQLLDTGNLALYEQCLIKMLLTHSHYQKQNKALVKQLLK